MKCSKCGYENLLKANYCYKCGNQFTQQEKDAAKEKALIGKIEKAEEAKGKFDKIKDILTLSFITDNVFVRLALIIAPFIISLVLGGGSGGNQMKIRDSNEYDVYYNTSTQEYFVEMDSGSVNLQLYVPQETESINIYFAESSGYNYQVGNYSVTDAIYVNENSNGYYTIEAVMGNETQSIKMYTV